ncbi:MAG: FAD-binding oxidoreductase [Chitinophagaceae bacterium]
MQSATKNISGWGNYPVVKATVWRPDTVDELIALVKNTPSILARGRGRSYGDSSLHHTVADITGLHKILNEGEDWIEVEAGITIEVLLQHIVPKKKFLPVTPGIKSITIGGAIASDVHGKNHCHAGSFFNTVQSLKLIADGGELLSCSRDQNRQLFLESFGSMGLTGIIASATISLIAIETTGVKEEQWFAGSFKELLQLMEAHKAAPYMAAWLDLLNKDVCGIVKTAGWVPEQKITDRTGPVVVTVGFMKSVPIRFPFALPAFAFKWFNRNYFSKAKKTPTRMVHYNDFFYPLDRIRNWNNLYGPNGMLQYHFQLPHVIAERGMLQVIEKIRQSKATCTLAVVKLFGKGNAETLYSFPQEGYNMALDFVHNKYAVSLIAEMDAIIKALGGSIYKTKDALSSIPQPVPNTTNFKSLQNTRYATQTIS